jgi:hypothetical protein
MEQRDWELLDKQVRELRPPRNDGVSWHFCDHSWAAAGPLATQSSFEISGAQIFCLKYQGLRFFRFCRFHTKIERESKEYESIGFRKRVRIDWFSQLQTISAVNCGGLGGNPLVQKGSGGTSSPR